MQVESHKAWKRATNKISKRRYRSNYQRKGLYTLPQINIDSFDHVHKECLLDLALFPAEKKICADALLDIWVYVEKLQRNDAFVILSELADINLLNLTGNPRGSTTMPYGNTSELYFSHRDGMRNLAMYLGHHDNILHCKRLFIERKNFGSLEKWELLRDRASHIQILSILTGPMEENDWYDMNFPETEALLLFFTSTEYFLPQFLKSMKKLKFLMIFNCGTNKAIVKGLDVLSSLTQLKSVRLERLILPFVEKRGIEALQNIEKLSLSLCEGFENISPFTKLKDFNLDHSNDLDLPLDISLCEGLKELPKEIGQLKKLRELDMRECTRLMALASTVCELSSLKLVTCDVTIGKQWLRAKNISIPELRVEIVEARFSLGWLDD
ncbi:hypothetical protein SUGI_0358850 [Cryptomeria japonica]|nr:hypothetical protein SUGI_0358850 [Cryptomeria japonica]